MKTALQIAYLIALVGSAFFTMLVLYVMAIWLRAQSSNRKPPQLVPRRRPF